MLKTFIGGTVCREFESEALAAEEMLGRVVCSSEEFTFQFNVLSNYYSNITGTTHYIFKYMFQSKFIRLFQS